MHYDFAYFKNDASYEQTLRNAQQMNIDVDDVTISFVQDSGKIYTHGGIFGGKPIEYTQGNGISIAKQGDANVISLNESWLNTWLSSNGLTNGGNSITYTAGDYINISGTGNTKTISVNRNQLNIPEAFLLHKATSDTLGGIYSNSGSVNNNRYPVFVDSDGRAWVTIIGTGGGSTSYDDSELRNRINNLNSLIEGLRSDLDDVHLANEESIKAIIQNIFLESEWIKNNFPWGEIFHYSGWNNEMKAYLLTVGLISEDGETVGWSDLILKYNSILATVNLLQSALNPDGTINFEMLQSNLEFYIDQELNAAVASIRTSWALVDENENILKWMTSGFEAQTSAYINFAQMYSTGMSEVDGKITTATAALKTNIERDIDDKITSAKAEVGASVDDKLAGYIAYANADQAISTLFAEDSNSGTKAAVLAAVQGDDSTIDLIASKINVHGYLTAQDISGINLTLNGKLTANNADITGTIRATSVYSTPYVDEYGIILTNDDGTINESTINFIRRMIFLGEENELSANGYGDLPNEPNWKECAGNHNLYICGPYTYIYLPKPENCPGREIRIYFPYPTLPANVRGESCIYCEEGSEKYIAYTDLVFKNGYHLYNEKQVGHVYLAPGLETRLISHEKSLYGPKMNSGYKWHVITRTVSENQYMFNTTN